MTQKKFANLIIIRLYFVFLPPKLSTMNIKFEDKALEELYAVGTPRIVNIKGWPKILSGNM